MRPTPRCIYTLSALWLCVSLGLFWPGAAVALTVLMGVVLFAGALDGLRLWRSALPAVRRAMPPMVPVNHRFDSVLHIESAAKPGAKSGLQGELMELCPANIEPCQEPLQVSIGASAQVLRFSCLPRQRGASEWKQVQWTAMSPLGLWCRRSLLPCVSQLAVYPDYASSRRQLDISLSRSLRELGVVQRRRSGDSQEFHQLRAYQPGDSLRQIDWKATSRKGQLVTRQYAEESNQSLVLMLDCGRRMALKHGERSLLDEALDAALMVAEVALRQGDKVTLQCFAGTPFYWSGENKTPGAVSHMLAQLHDFHPRLEASDYVAAARTARSLIKRPSTVLLVTHSRNESLRELNTAARLLGDRHRLVVADIADKALQDVLATEPVNFDGALSYCGALDYQHKRQRAQQQLRGQGTDVVEVAPQQLVGALAQAYHRHRGQAA